MTKQTHHKKIVTVITEAALETTLTRDIERLGASGYTITDSRGKGSRGVRSAGWDSNSNIRIEVICDEATARSISRHFQATYYAHYSMVLFISEAEVLREHKF